ncbi:MULTISPECIES: type II toxin-antitoxin system ParD family antitoxin [Oceanibaculum]|uniref:Antitoxin ParD1/3/4 n=1 Tax=Oceanibaculum indicum TaxID=526216 RepID=A0A420WAK4_9PROT|nr:MULTISPECIES: type II toxin-antitoxin system ParD family antitoxin [Oceanibaculum]MCH2395656.1 type II toxin-antitoxin system ParD family antitoxin [Oceanibaculum sp.]RKQ68041.1 antitoxin ParD1/3/4 [Oceanibaculum indicum]
MTTNVSLTQELEDFTRQCVDSGRFGSVSEVVRHALRLMQEQEGRKAAFLSALKEARAGEARELDLVLRQADTIIDGRR